MEHTNGPNYSVDAQQMTAVEDQPMTIDNGDMNPFVDVLKSMTPEQRLAFESMCIRRDAAKSITRRIR